MKEVKVAESRTISLAVGSSYPVGNNVQAEASCFGVLACIGGKEMAVAGANFPNESDGIGKDRLQLGRQGFTSLSDDV